MKITNMEQFPENWKKDNEPEQEGLPERALDFATAEGVKGKAEEINIELRAAKKPIDIKLEVKEREEKVRKELERVDKKIKEMLDSSPRIRDHIDRLLIEKKKIMINLPKLANPSLGEKNEDVIDQINKQIKPIDDKIKAYVRVLSEQYIQKDEQEILKRAFEENQDSQKIAEIFERIYQKDHPIPENIADENYKYWNN